MARRLDAHPVRGCGSHHIGMSDTPLAETNCDKSGAYLA